MIEPELLIKQWFDCWESGRYREIPVSEDFIHESPFGIIKGRSEYLDLVERNKRKFLDQTFEVLDEIYGDKHASIRYIARQGKDFQLDVSEWFYFNDNLIKKIIAYYHIGEIRNDRRLS